MSRDMKGDDQLAERVKRARGRADFSQEGLARESGLTVGTIQKIEQGENLNPTLATLQAIARACRVDASELLPKERHERRA